MEILSSLPYSPKHRERKAFFLSMENSAVRGVAWKFLLIKSIFKEISYDSIIISHFNLKRKSSFRHVSPGYLSFGDCLLWVRWKDAFDWLLSSNFEYYLATYIFIAWRVSRPFWGKLLKDFVSLVCVEIYVILVSNKERSWKFLTLFFSGTQHLLTKNSFLWAQKNYFGIAKKPCRLKMFEITLQFCVNTKEYVQMFLSR